MDMIDEKKCPHPMATEHDDGSLTCDYCSKHFANDAEFQNAERAEFVSDLDVPDDVL